MKINVLTLFPDMFTPLQVSMLGRGLEDKKWELNLVNFRDFTSDVHHHVDDTPYGGGAGMVLQIMPIKKALDSLNNKGKVIITAPQGSPQAGGQVPGVPHCHQAGAHPAYGGHRHCGRPALRPDRGEFYRRRLR